MTSFDNLQKRLKYRGVTAEDRMENDKMRGLKKALLYSHQGETIVTKDGREFRCLINPNKETGDYDNKILAIPYSDICLNEGPYGKTSEGQTKLGIKCGDIIYWKETKTYWIIFLEYLEETAYFRAQIRKCEQQALVDGKEYWVYIRGPLESSIAWNSKAQTFWNDLNQSLVLYITLDKNTIKLNRFSKIKVRYPLTNEFKTWQIVSANPYYGDGIVQLYLDEYFENPVKEAAEKEKEENYIPTPLPPKGTPYIDGPDEVSPFDKVEYSIQNAEGGYWEVTVGTNKIVSENPTITFEVLVKKGIVTLLYIKDEEIVASKEVKIVAF